MKLLILVNNPDRASFRVRAIDFLESFRREGIQCDVHKLPRKKLERWRLFKRAGEYDGVLLHRKCLNFFDARVLRRYSRKIIFDHDDAIMYSPSRPESDRTSHFRLYKRTLSIVDCAVAGNDYLAEHAGRFCEDVHVVPTGLDVGEYDRQCPAREDGEIRLVWIGSESTLPYLEELRSVLEEIGSRYPNVVLRIIADRFFDLKNMRVQKHVWSLQNQVDDLLMCDIGLAPLPDDRFTRGKCGFKILQYFSAGLAVIASPVGVNRKFIEESRAGLTASTPEQWMNSVIKLIDDASLRRTMGENGKGYVRQYDKAVVAKEFGGILKNVITGVNQ